MAETSSELQAEVEKLERKHAEHPEGRYFVPLANAYRKLGQLQAAESILREGLRRHPEYLSAHIVLGRCLADQGTVGPAAEEFRYVLSLDPQNLVALRSLGELSLTGGRADEAGRWYQELLTADPMNEEARRALEQLRLAGGAADDGPDPVGAAPEALHEPLAPSEPPPEPEEIPVPIGSLPAGDEEYAFYGGFVDLGAGDVAEEDEEEDSPELVTETIAELYARQGLHGRAADVYRELIRRRGGDAGLQRRLAEQERLAAGEPALPPEPQPEPEPPLPQPAASLPAAAAPEPLPGFDEPMLLDAEEEFFLPPLDLASLEPEPRAEIVAEPTGRAAEASAGEAAAPAMEPTIAQFLADLAAWRPGSPAPAKAPVAEPDLPLYPSSFPTMREDTGGTGPAGEDLFAWELPEPAGLDPLPDEAPAPSPPPMGEPDAVPAELSLPPAPASEPARPSAAPPATQAEVLPDSAERGTRVAPAAPPAASAEDDDDLESFQAWLRSLKR